MLGAMIVTPMFAQQKDLYPELEGPGPVVIISKDKNGKEELINVFEETQRPHFHDPRAPRFLLTDQQGKFALGIGGYLKTTMEYDFNGIVDDVDFIPALIPQPGSTAVRNQFQMDASTSTIFLKLVGRTKHLGNFIVYTAGNFRGSGKTFELQNAYLSFLGFTMGYDTGLFMDLAAAPPTIDFQGPDGMTFYRATQLRYEANLIKGLKVGVGVEMPSVDGTPAKDVRIGKQRMPDIPAYVQYSWAKASHIRVGGILRSMTYEDQVNNKAKSLIYAFVGQGKLPLGFINHKYAVKVGFCFHQAGLDGIAQPVLGGLVNYLERRQGLHSRQRSPGGAGGGKA